MAEDRSIFDSISPVDYRYYERDLERYLSENGFVDAKATVEAMLVAALPDVTPRVIDEVKAVCAAISAAAVAEEEQQTRHDVRALVNCIQRAVSPAARPYVHRGATSYDIVDTANAVRYSRAVGEVLLPALRELIKVLIEIAEREAETVQIGRTHGQHAVPITFGFAIAGYVSRLGQCYQAIERVVLNLPGKFSGAVGAYNASALFFEDPRAFEAKVLEALDLRPAEHSTQVVPPESLTRLFSEIIIMSGVLANLADDMRNLQRTEIAEVGEAFDSKSQVGSSTMPQKRNPISFENAKSLWKIIMPRLMTVFMDQISEHQRDLTNSASSRTYGEIIAYAVSMIRRLKKAMGSLTVNHEALRRNLESQGQHILAEPLYILLAAHGHPDAHEAVRQLTLQIKPGQSLIAAAKSEVSLEPYLNSFTKRQLELFDNPVLYIGIAPRRAREIAKHWRLTLGL